MSLGFREREMFVPVSRDRNSPKTSGVPHVLFAGRGDRAAAPFPSQQDEQPVLPAPQKTVQDTGGGDKDMKPRLEQQAKVIALQGQKIHELEDRLRRAKVRAMEGIEEDEEEKRLKTRLQHLEIVTGEHTNEINALIEAREQAESDLQRLEDLNVPDEEAAKEEEYWKNTKDLELANQRLAMKVHYGQYHLKSKSEYAAEMKHQLDNLEQRHRESLKLQDLEEHSLRQMSAQRDVEILKTQQQLTTARQTLDQAFTRVQAGPDVESEQIHAWKAQELRAQERISGAIQHLKEMQGRLYRAEEEAEAKNRALQDVVREISSLRDEVDAIQPVLMC